MAARPVTLALLLVFCLAGVTYAGKRQLRLDNDNRAGFMFEKFGFVKGGHFSVNITKLELLSDKGELLDLANSKPLAIYVKITSSDNYHTSIHPFSADGKCVAELDNTANANYKVFPIEQIPFPVAYEMAVEADEGIWNVFLINCNEKTKVSLELTIDNYYEDRDGVKNYLPVGDWPLPGIFGAVVVIHLGMAALWIVKFMRGTDRSVNKVHWMMCILLFIKAGGSMCQAIEYHFLQISGEAGGWNVIYYIFSFLRGMGMFAIILAIGSGWAFLKPFLSDREKRIFAIIIPLQILDNIALIVIEENMEGAAGYESWRNIFSLIDIICCGAVVIPIIWSIRHLKEAAQTDGKARRSLNKLHLFRRFYLSVVAYIYFTRIIVLLLTTTIPFRWIWLTDFFTEAATIIFFVATGYQFRPIKDNPYFKVEDSDEEEAKARVQMEEMDAAD